MKYTDFYEKDAARREAKRQARNGGNGRPVQSFRQQCLRVGRQIDPGEVARKKERQLLRVAQGTAPGSPEWRAYAAFKQGLAA